ncbi:TetR/AcrR family transcriptional regulator [Xanthomonas sp. AmX2]|uniref:TetR/AcrR family transcriptional regulator n=1 Tax=Xanthomonas sp. TaxID=29446 RepID=UPI00197DFDA7|nr:TetR/AcrR family transcriptional regulator [Xanthomonas sp.]MBN6151104.1 TetR/AcrR family transcriptional regulator [Xanthomonas sp.]
MSMQPRKGDLTRERLVGAGCALARTEGLDGVTIGALAALAGMSKSGVFAHFGTREDLQLCILDRASEEFTEQVFRPALRERRGLPRFRAIARHWLRFLRDMGKTGGCVLMAAASEFDDKPGPLRERVRTYQRQLRGEIQRCAQMAIDAGDLRSESDAAQIAFETYAVALACHHDLRLFGADEVLARAERAMEALLQRYIP